MKNLLTIIAAFSITLTTAAYYPLSVDSDSASLVARKRIKPRWLKRGTIPIPTPMINKNHLCLRETSLIDTDSCL